MSWFLVPTVALCEQQREVIDSHLPVSVGMITGANEPDQWKDHKLWQHIGTARHGSGRDWVTQASSDLSTLRADTALRWLAWIDVGIGYIIIAVIFLARLASLSQQTRSRPSAH